MNAVVQSLPVRGKPSAVTDGDSAADGLAHRRSKELVVGLCGPIGSGLQFVKAALESALRARDYEIVHVKVSDMMSPAFQALGLPEPNDVDGSAEFKRIMRMQTVGNELRTKLGQDVGAQLTIKLIAEHRISRPENEGKDVAEIVPERVAYIVDQLKHPGEAVLLRKVYGNLFYLVGALCGYEQRKANLSAKVSSPEAERLIHRDKSESDSSGQQLEKTLKLADFFVRNTHHNVEMLRRSLERFVGLIHGMNGLTPTNIESGMYAAYTAGLESACLSRQVGAAIVAGNGSLISSGCNDVPRSGGGLYKASPVNSSYTDADHRCVFKGAVCYNDQHKDKLRDQVAQVLREAGVANPEALAQKIRKDTRLKDLIEFSRSVHAEMDAIVKVARAGGPSVQGAFLFTTTYPCHNCARHIVASGIRAVYFIEPYEKSLAEELHGDAIEHEPSIEPDWRDYSAPAKVAFLHFEGVAPHRYASLFAGSEDRKSTGGAARSPEQNSAMAREPEYLDDYKALEARVVARLKAKGALQEAG